MRKKTIAELTEAHIDSALLDAEAAPGSAPVFNVAKGATVIYCSGSGNHFMVGSCAAQQQETSRKARAGRR